MTDLTDARLAEIEARAQGFGYGPGIGVVLELVRELRRYRAEGPSDPCSGEIVTMLRQAAKRVTGGNCAFADDDITILEHLAERAVQAGLTDQLGPNVQNHIRNRERLNAAPPASGGEG